MGSSVIRIPLRIPMRDGATLGADLYTTDNASQLRPRPVVVQRTPYDRYMDSYTRAAKYLAARGYSCIVQDVRGRNDSDGVWAAHAQEPHDGYDTIQWLAEQPFSNGSVGTLGGSYAGWVQLASAAEHPPALKTMIVTSGHLQLMKGFGRNADSVIPRALTWVYKMSERHMRTDVDEVDWDAVLRTRPLITAADDLGSATRDMWRDWLEHPELVAADPVREGAEVTIDVPTLHISGWEDEPGQSRIYQRALDTGSRDQYLLVGPWDHPGTRNPQRITRGIDYGDDAVIDMEQMYRRWFDRWLANPSPTTGRPGATAVFMNGTNTWHARSEEAVQSEPRRFAVAPDAEVDSEYALVAAECSAVPGTIQIRHDPSHPVQATGSRQYGDPLALNTLAELERHPDVVAVDVAASDFDGMVHGTIDIQLDTSCDAPSADWCVWIADVSPVGTITRVTSDTARVAYEGNERVVAHLQLGPISHHFRAGHLLRLYIAGSNFPVIDINAGSGGTVFDAGAQGSTNTIHYGGSASTTVSVPVSAPQPALKPQDVHGLQWIENLA